VVSLQTGLIQTSLHFIVTLPAEVNRSYLQKPSIAMKYDTCAVSTVLCIIRIE